MDFLAKLKKEISEAKAAAARPKQALAPKVVFKETRQGLRLSQSEFARMLGVSTKSVQGWEQGNPIPESIMILAELIQDFPVVKRRLLLRVSDRYRTERS